MRSSHRGGVTVILFLHGIAHKKRTPRRDRVVCFNLLSLSLLALLSTSRRHDGTTITTQTMAELLVNTLNRTPSSECLQVIDEEDATLQEVKKFMEETYSKASSLYETAKWLWQDVHALRTKQQQVDDAMLLHCTKNKPRNGPSSRLTLPRCRT